MIRQGGTRRPLLALTTVAAALTATTVGGGVFASLTDTVVSEGNTLESGEQPMTALAATSVEDGGCEGMAPGSGRDHTIPATVTGGDDRSSTVCLRNDGTVPADIVLRFVDVVETEIDCAPGESEAGDTSCGGDGIGEYSSVIDVRVGGCSKGTLPFDAFLAGEKVAQLAPGASCALELEFLEAGERDALAIAQTDRIQWDQSFTAEGRG